MASVLRLGVLAAKFIKCQKPARKQGPVSVKDSLNCNLPSLTVGLLTHSLSHHAPECAQRRFNVRARHVVMRDHANRRSKSDCQDAPLTKFSANAVGTLAGFGDVNDHN